MSLPKTIRATVSPAMIGKVGRLFNGTIDDVLAELFQNARRAGASRIGVSVLDLDGRRRLVVVDNGAGINDPATLLSLGRSGWDGKTALQEDPAGMGFFSLAGRLVEVRSRSRALDAGWRMVIEPDAWDAARAIPVEPFGIAGGTELLIDLPQEWERQLDEAVARAARHLPLTVLLQGAECARVDWLADAVRVEEWQGSRIGVFRGVPPSAYEPTINFHGVTVTLALPKVSEPGTRIAWHARIDIADTPRLQLVLPARKEVVQTAFLDDVRVACEAAIYRAVAASGPHRLAYADYLRSRELGVPLGEAAPCLHGWRADVADTDVRERGPLIAGDMLLMPSLDPSLAQTAARGLALLGTPLPLVAEESRLEGYGWYDALDRVTDVRLTFVRDGVEQPASDEGGEAIASGQVERITVELVIVGARGSDRVVAVPTDVAVVANDDYPGSLDDVALLVTPGATIGVSGTVDLLVRAAFEPSEDHDSDSYDTQREWFEQAALHLARTHLISADAAITGAARDHAVDQLRWLVPSGRTLLIAVTADAAEAVFQDASPDADDGPAFVAQIAALAARSDTADPAAALKAIRRACAARRRVLLARTTAGLPGTD